MTTEQDLIVKIDLAIQHAAALMDMRDYEHLEEDTDESLDVMEERFHCGTCIVCTVMDAVWPSVEEYVDYLKELSADLVALSVELAFRQQESDVVDA